MNYIYDVLTNFQDNYYDFFEWEKKDPLNHFKKIPIIKINKEDYNNILKNKIQINEELLKKIKNKAEFFNNKNNNDNYYLLITNGSDIQGIEFDKSGNSIKKSSLLVDEELDILNTIKRIENKTINYKIIEKIKPIFKTRNDIKKQSLLISKLNELSIIKDINKINYLYYECFNKHENNPKVALNILIKNINDINISNTLYELFTINKTISK